MDRKKLVFGMPTLIENRTLEENIGLCRELGLKFVELNMNLPDYQTDRLSETERFREAASEAGIFYTIHLDEDLDIANFNPLVRTAYQKTAMLAIGAAKVLKAPVLNMHMHHGVHFTLPDRKVQLYSEHKDLYLREFKAFRAQCEEAAGDSGILICIENTEGFRDYEKEAVELLLESPVFGLTWDIGHSKAEGEKDLPFIAGHQDRLKHFHIHDCIESTGKNHLALGDGEIDLAARLELAEVCGACCVLETKTKAALIQSVSWLKERGYL